MTSVNSTSGCPERNMESLLRKIINVTNINVTNINVTNINVTNINVTNINVTNINVTNIFFHSYSCITTVIVTQYAILFKFQK